MSFEDGFTTTQSGVNIGKINVFVRNAIPTRVMDINTRKRLLNRQRFAWIHANTEYGIREPTLDNCGSRISTVDKDPQSNSQQICKILIKIVLSHRKSN